MYIGVDTFLKENTARATEAPNMMNTNKLRINPVASPRNDKSTVQTEPPSPATSTFNKSKFLGKSGGMHNSLSNFEP